MTSDAQKRAFKKYHSKFDELKVRVPSGEGDVIRSHAVERGESTNQFLCRAIKEAMERDKQKQEQLPSDK